MMPTSVQCPYVNKEKHMSRPRILKGKFFDNNQVMRPRSRSKRKNLESLESKTVKRSLLNLPKTPRDPIYEPLRVEEVYPYGIEFFSDDDNAEVPKIFDDFPRSPLPSTPEYRPLTPRDFSESVYDNKKYEPVPKSKILKTRDFSAQTDFFSEREIYEYGIHSRPEYRSRLIHDRSTVSSGCQTSKQDVCFSSSVEQDSFVEDLKSGHQSSSATLVAQTSKYVQRKAHREKEEILALRHGFFHLEDKKESKKSQTDLSKSKRRRLNDQKITPMKHVSTKKPVLSKLEKLRRRFSRELFKR